MDQDDAGHNDNGKTTDRHIDMAADNDDDTDDNASSTSGLPAGFFANQKEQKAVESKLNASAATATADTANDALPEGFFDDVQACFFCWQAAFLVNLSQEKKDAAHRGTKTKAEKRALQLRYWCVVVETRVSPALAARNLRCSKS